MDGAGLDECAAGIIFAINLETPGVVRPRVAGDSILHARDAPGVLLDERHVDDFTGKKTQFGTVGRDYGGMSDPGIKS